MKQQIADIIRKSFSLEHSSRTDRTKKNILLLYFFYGFNFVFTLAIVPVSLQYLGQLKYGIWLTISSLLMWMSYLDFGIGNGLRNKVSESLAINDKQLAKTYISTAYAVFSIGVLFIMLLFFSVQGLFNWDSILKVPVNLSEEVRAIVYIVFVFFLLQLLSKLITSIINADQKTAINGFLSFLNNFLTIAGIFILSKISSGSLFLLGTYSAAIPILVFVIATVILFKRTYKEIAPAVGSIKFKYAKELLQLGFQFFIIQFAGLVVFATDNVIITQLFSPEDVTIYNVAYKYFYIIQLVFSVILTPFWSAFTEAYVKEDIIWIKAVLKKILLVWVALSFITILMITFSDTFYKIWVGDKIKIPFLLSVVMGLFTILTNWSNIFVYFINGVGKIRLQFYISIFVAIINIPLCILFAKMFNFGITGIMVATCVCVLFGSIWAPIQYKKIIARRDRGIWSK